MLRYNSGSYKFGQSRFTSLISVLFEYLLGVTLPRQSINRLKPQVMEKITGDIVEIGGYENYFKEKYIEGKFLNLDLKPNSGVVDLVGDAEKLSSLVESGSLGGVFCISVLEHTRNPHRVVDEIYKSLRPGGVAFISSPWMFESNMEPHDYFRFSRHQNEIYFNQFEIVDVNYTNSYLGLIAHALQFNLILRFSLGWLFLFADMMSTNNARWATQISYTLKKPVSSRSDTSDDTPE